MRNERVVSATAVIEAPASVVFEWIADPARQPVWDANENLARSDDGQRVQSVGDVFVTTLSKGSIRHNHVVEFAEGRRIAWLPAEPGENPVGHLWRWIVEPLDDSRCRVTHTYDWSGLDDTSRFARARATTSDRLLASIARLSSVVRGDTT